MKNNITIIFLLLIQFSLAQNRNEDQKRILSATSPFGNYLYVVPFSFQEKDSTLLNTTDYFIIERAPFDSTSQNGNELKNIKKIGILKCIQNLKELKNFYDDNGIESFRKFYKLKSKNDVVNYFITHANPVYYLFFYSFLETKQALGHVFVDNDVKPGEKYIYFITRVDKDKTTLKWGNCTVISKAGNYLLPYFKPKQTELFQSDSSIGITWKLPIPPNTVNSIPVPKMLLDFDSTGKSFNMPFSLHTLQAKVYELGENGEYITTQQLLPQLNATQDTITYKYSKKCLPEQATTVFIRPEDEVHNEGVDSDTTLAFSVSQKHLLLLKAIQTSVEENGIKVYWNKIPQKPYIKGIELGKYNSQDKYDSLATLSSTDTFYLDRDVVPGQHYRYQAKIVYMPQLSLKQNIPATAIGTITKFSKPLPPYNLTATYEGKNIRLNWECKDILGSKGFFVYRGTDPNKLQLASELVTDKTFLDTAAYLNGRSFYYYAVNSENLIQDTSIYSNIVKISPNRAIQTSLINSVKFYYTNGKLNVSWDDGRKDDNAIIGFKVQRKIEGEKEFTLLTKDSITNNYITDSNIVAGLKYYYRIANVDIKNQTSDFGEVGIFSLEKPAVDVVNIFYVRNIDKAIEVSLPTVLYDNRKLYNIYRKEAGVDIYEKIASINADTFTYIDKAVKPNQVYMYAITITEKDDREGVKGKAISVRKD